MKGQIVPCTKEEMERLIDATVANDFCYMLFSVAKKTGRRLGEYCGEREMKEIGTEEYIDKNGLKKTRPILKPTSNYLGGVKVKDIDFEKKIMMTEILKRRKRVMKEAILDDDLILLIKRYVAQKKLKLDDYLFREIGYRQIQNKVIKYAKVAMIPHKVSFHNFRHYFVTELFKKGFSYEKISKLTGHGSVGTLAIYDHSVASDIAVEARELIKSL